MPIVDPTSCRVPLAAFAGWVALAAGSIATTACSGSLPSSGDTATGVASFSAAGSPAPYPPGTAQLLSMANAHSMSDDDPFTAAVSCHAAIGALTQALEQTPFVGGEVERNAARQAKARFLGQAKQAGARQGMAPGDVNAKIEDRRVAALDNMAAELPRASGCLRSLFVP